MPRNRSADGSCVHGSRDWSCWICWTPREREEGRAREMEAEHLEAERREQANLYAAVIERGGSL